MPETNRIEYKEKINDNLLKEVVAFLNYLGGGIIYFGIDKNGNTIGIDDVDKAQLFIKDTLRNNIVPSCLGLFDIIVEKQKIIKLIVASGSERPYYIKKYGLSEKGAFIRTGSAAEPMSAKMIETLFAKRTRNSIGKIKSPRKDLTFEQLRIYYDAVGKTLNDRFANNLELLDEDGTFNYVAYLMADNNAISIKVARYNGKDRVDLIQSNEYGFCSLIKATKQVLDRIEVENITLTKITSKERLEKRLWNMVALREAIINSIVHNDYSREVAPKFELFDDRIEITSYGGIPDGLGEQEFFEGYSIPRNKEIMRIFRDLDLVEQLGSGLPRILKSYGRECFYFTENHVRMIFPTSEILNEEGEQVVTDVTENVTDDVTDTTKNVTNVTENVTDRELLILEMMKTDNTISLSQVAKKLSVTKMTIIRDVEKLKANGLIERKGNNKVGYWQVLRLV